VSRRLIHARRKGFTIIEILIAIVVLVLGITGIVALFPTAIESGNQTVEDTYSATITQSVVDAISVGLRESRYSYRTPPPGRVWTYFILNHDGVMDAPVRTPENFLDNDAAEGQIWRKDYCVVLPQGTAVQNQLSANEVTFVYPLPTFFETGGDAWLNIDQRQPSALNTGNLSNVSFAHPDNFRRQTAEGQSALWFPRVYHLGRFRVGDPNSPITDPGTGAGGYDNYVTNVRRVRDEYRGENIVGGTPTPGGEETIAVDPYPNYSFAFTLKRARVDTMTGAAAPGTLGGDGRITEADHFSNSLYELKVYIFKNFNLNIARDLRTPPTGGGPVVPRTNRPVRRFITLMSL